MNSTVKTALLWLVIIVLVFLLWNLFQTTKGQSEQIPYSVFVDRVNAGHVEKVTIRGDEIRGAMKANAPGQHEFHLNGPNTTLTAGAVGTIRDAADMRIVQLGMRFSF